jgi:predicted negative regulator of RcsB-dependent stress response
MVDDYFSDREQEEALRNWWRENWRWLVAGVALGFAMLGGWQYWKSAREQRAHAAAELYSGFQKAIEARNLDEANRVLAQLVDEHKASGYTQQARLLLARSHVENGAYDHALALLRAVSASSEDEELAQVARLRAARVLIQLEKYDEALGLLETDKAGAFAAQVREVRGDALLAKGDAEGARAEYAAALASNSDAQIDRAMLELKLQDVGGARNSSDQVQP